MTPGGRAPITKFKSAYKLSDAQQCALVAAVDWREAEARRLDRPRSWILGDKVLTAIARSVPRSVRELSEIPDIPGGLVRRAGEHLDRCDQCRARGGYFVHYVLANWPQPIVWRAAPVVGGAFGAVGCGCHGAGHCTRGLDAES